MTDATAPPQSPLKAAIVRVTPFEQNCTLIWDEASKVGAVIDPGGDLDRIERGIAEAGISIEKILLTHGHIDHAGAADELREKLGVKIEGPHKADAILLDNLEKQGEMYGIPGVRNVTPDRWLDEGDRVTVAGHTFEIFHCPGHSPGSVVFFDRGATLRSRRRRAISRLDRPDRFSLWRSRGAHLVDQDEAASARRRHRLHLRTWPDRVNSARNA